eukprot:Tamp_15143.p1 GENE.Tamp_15143~~Tamp_15143.p1  ORF type:complete len:343 (-),score=69.65 Tamp_15143:538-1422(-)
MVHSDGAAVPRRAAVLAGTAAAVLGWSRASFAAGDKGGAEEPEITDKVYFDFKISGRTKALENPKWEKIIARDKRASGYTDAEFSQGGTDTTVRMVVGLYGEEAPKTVAAFLELAEGDLMAPCIDEDEATGDPEDFASSQRSKLTKRQIYKQCKAQEDKPVGYEYSQVWRVVKDQRIDLGRINKQFRQAPYNDDENSLKHDKAGLLSMVKNGGVFEFTMTPKANPKLDETNTVFGRVLEGEEVVELFNEMPATQGQFLEGAFKFSGKLIGDGRADLDTKNRPLQKITVLRCGVL